MTGSMTFLSIPLLAWIPLLPILGALINLTIGRKFARTTVNVIAIGSVLLAFCVALYCVADPLRHAFMAWRAEGGEGKGLLEIKQVLYTWIEVGSFKVELAFRLDTLSAVMILIVTFIGTLIHIYSTGYMSDEKRFSAYFGYLNLFMGAMLILVLAANLPVMFIGWEGVGLCSFLLIGFWFENPAYATAGRKAFVVNRIGDFAFLLGMFLLYWACKDQGFTQSLDFGDFHSAKVGAALVQPYWGGERLACAAGILLFIGACGKSAQVPLYVWLPDAMAGPTPVSALIHAATMVTAGVYMLCRLSPLFAASTTALAVVATVGTITALMAAFMAFTQTDLKKVLAYSTVSQLGFMFAAAGTGHWVAAVFHLMTHAFFKAGLFLGAGSVMHGMNGSGDIRKMGGLRKHMPITRITFFIFCLAIAGFPLTAGFFSKDEILAGLWGAQPPGWPLMYGKILWAALSIAALGTAFYMWRLYFLVFSGEERSDDAHHAHESPASMTLPLVVLAIFAAFVGFIGVPEIAGLHLPNVFHGLAIWLEPSLAQNWYEGTPINVELSGHTTVLLMAFASAVGIFGIGLAWMLYGRGGKGAVPAVGKLTRGPLAGVYAASKNKLWVDEIYEVVFIKPFRILARGCYEIVDRFIIDTVVVNGSALVISMLSRINRWFQNGQVQRYIAAMVVGAAAIFFVTTWRSHPTFEYRQAGGVVELRAMPGAGVAAIGTKFKWDLDGDGEPDKRPNSNALLDDAVVQIRSGEIGASVTLWIESGVSKEVTKVTRRIDLSKSDDAPTPVAAVDTGSAAQQQKAAN